jgi:RNA polymerase sigma-70 factor (ECF subfamily)
LLRAEAAGRLRQAMRELPDSQREAIRLRHFEGWSLREMASLFNRSEAAVAGLLKRGLRQLRSHFSDSDRASSQV